MKKILILLVLLNFIGCASKNGGRSSLIGDDNDAEAKLDLPVWVYEADKYCKDELELCTSAEAQSFASAELHAKKSLASTFESKIKSHFEIEQHDYSSQEVNSIVERVHDQVSESVDLVLKGVYIKEKHKQDKLYFALAVLDKVKATKILKREINLVDNELNFLFKKGHKSSILKMHMLFDKREILNQKYLILTNRSVPTDFNFSKISSLRYSNNKLNRIHVKAINSVPRTLLKWMESAFTQVGYKVIKGNDVDYLVRIKYFAKEEYLQVRGFKKFTFSIVADAKNNAGDKLGGFTVELLSTGRNKQDAYLKVKGKLQEEFKKYMDQLNLK